MKLKIDVIHDLPYVSLGEEVDETSGLTMFNKIKSNDGTTEFVMSDTDKQLWSCWLSESHDDHGNRSTYYGSSIDDSDYELYGGDFMSGSWSTEVELAPVTEIVEIVEVKRYVKKETNE